MIIFPGYIYLKNKFLLAILKDNCLIIPLKYCRLGKGWEPEGVEAAGLIRGSFLKVQINN
jgi:hypothetical protein